MYSAVQKKIFSSQILLAIFLLQLLGSFALENNSSLNITCPSPEKCVCLSKGDNGYEISCPTEENYHYYVAIQLPEFAEFLCKSNSRVNTNEQNYESLTGLKVGPVQSIKFYYCWLPQNISLAEFAQNIDVKTAQELKFSFSKNLGKSLQEKPLAGFEHLEKLTLYENRLENIPSDFLAGFDNLTDLNLASNKINHLDESFFNFVPKLENLNLGQNRFTSFGFLTNLTKLKILNLSFNDLTNISRSLFSNLANLEELDLSYTKLQTLPADLFQDLGKLRKLKIGGNNFSLVPEALSALVSKLEYLELTSNEHITLPDYFLSNFTQLKEAQLSGNWLRSISEQVFWNCTVITRIDLSFNKLQSLPQQLFRDQINLKFLNLKRNNLEHIPDYIFKNLAELEELNLNNNQLQNISRYAFHGLDKLKILKLSENQLSYLDSEAFRVVHQLNHLDLSRNELSFKAEGSNLNTTAVTEDRSPLQYCTNLEHLNLAGNSIEKIFTEWRLNLLKLRNLDLIYNKIERLNTDDIYFTSDNVTVNLARNQISVIDLSGVENLKTGLWSTYPPRNVKGRIEVKLDRNPLRCDCQASDFIRYLGNDTWPADVNFTLILKPGDLKCKEPEALRGVLAEKVDPNSLC